MMQLAFVGYGLRSRTMMDAFTRMAIPVRVAAIADPCALELQRQNADNPIFKDTHYYQDDQSMYTQENPDGVFIGTRCALHPEMAIRAFELDLPVFLEKPVCIDEAGYQTLLPYAARQGNRTLVSFPLRFTAIVRHMKEIADSGALGEITMVQAVNNVPYGSVYYHSWYRDASLTGGLFMQKMTHDIDYISYISGKRPVEAAAMSSKLYFKGNHPEGLHCPDCHDFRSCPESSYVVEKLLYETPTGDACCFGSDTGNEDQATVIYRAEGGSLISYSQNFIVKKSAGRRGARFIGTKASMEFDFYNGTIRLDDYTSQRVTTHQYVYPPTTHFGGDDALAFSFYELLQGKPSGASLCDGMLSAKACLAARESAASGRFVRIDYGF